MRCLPLFLPLSVFPTVLFFSLYLFNNILISCNSDSPLLSHLPPDHSCRIRSAAHISAHRCCGRCIGKLSLVDITHSLRARTLRGRKKGKAKPRLYSQQSAKTPPVGARESARRWAAKRALGNEHCPFPLICPQAKTHRRSCTPLLPLVAIIADSTKFDTSVIFGTRF